MEILLWLAPTVVVAVLAVLWVSWLSWWGREGRGEVRRDESLRRLGASLGAARPDAVSRAPSAPADPTAGAAVRRLGPAPLRSAPAPAATEDDAPAAADRSHPDAATGVADDGEGPARRVS